MLAFACAFTMFAGAAFTDAADINADNTEAVDLLTTLGIIKGYEDGSFQPDGTVTRAEMAKMIYTIRNDGNDDASAYENVTTSFTDISGHWAEGYVKYLQNTGIVAGKSATRFDPDSQVTTGEAMKMALALGGYDEEHAGLTGINWLNNTVSLATTNGLTDDVASAISGGCTRQDAAQILSNALGMTAVRWSSVVENFVNDSKDGLAFGGEPISVGEKWMDLCTDVGTLIRLDSSTLTIRMSTNDVPDSYHNTADDYTFTKITTDYSQYLGQRVKVLFNDGKMNDVIGVYSVPDNDVLTVYKNEIEAENAKIKIDGELYSLETKGVETIINGELQDDNWHAVDFVEDDSADVVTLIDSDDNNKLDTAVIKTVEVKEVTFVSANQIIADGQTYKFADENIAEDVAVDDYVVITENLFNENKDIVVAEKVTGTVEATKGTTAPYDEYQIGDTWYKTAANDDDINASVKSGTEVEYVVVNNILFYAKKVSGASGSLADIVFVSYVGTNGLNDDQVRVMYPDGKVATLTYDEDDSDTVVAGQFYEYEVTGGVYELHNPNEYAAGANPDYENYYGDYTYYGAKALTTATNGASGAPAAKFNGVTIDDDADVIVYAADTNDPVENTSVKHITGKQLKSVANALNLTANNDATTDKTSIRNVAIGGFISEVDGFDRATVIAVRYNSADGEFGSNMSNLESNSNYGYIVSGAVKVSEGIRFDMITADSDDVVTVIADKNTTTGFDKGAVIGYSSITQGENDKFATVNDPTVIEDINNGGNLIADTITATNGSDKVSTNSDTEMDLDDFTTVIFTNSYAGDIEKVVDGSPRKAKDGRINILYIEDEVAIIDANQIVGDVYADNTVTATGFANGASIQWTDATTGETWKGSERGAYDNAVLNVSITTKTDGKVTLTGSSNGLDKTYDIEANEPLKIDGIIVGGNITVAFGNSASTATGVDAIKEAIKGAFPADANATGSQSNPYELKQVADNDDGAAFNVTFDYYQDGFTTTVATTSDVNGLTNDYGISNYTAALASGKLTITDASSGSTFATDEQLGLVFTITEDATGKQTKVYALITLDTDAADLADAQKAVDDTVASIETALSTASATGAGTTADPYVVALTGLSTNWSDTTARDIDVLTSISAETGVTITAQKVVAADAGVTTGITESSVIDSAKYDTGVISVHKTAAAGVDGEGAVIEVEVAGANGTTGTTMYIVVTLTAA